MSERPRQALRAGTSIGVLAFWCGMWMAGRLYPSEYDWRYMTLSSLVYPERNPRGYPWAWSGVALCALAGLGWTGVRVWRGRQPRSSSSAAAARLRGNSTGIAALGIGYLCMLFCGLLPAPLLRLPRLHEVLALTAFLGVGVGLVASTLQSARESVWLAALPGNPRWYAGALASAALSPIALAALAQTYVAAALPQLHWVSLAWRARGVPMYLSFAFWEWTACALFSVYMWVLCWTTPVGHASPSSGC